jgi:hypothetical protein
VKTVDRNVSVFRSSRTRIQASKSVQKRRVKRHVVDALDPLQCDESS